MSRSAKETIDSFSFDPGRVIARKYEVVRRLGGGWEGEVYLLKEIATGIERAAKLFFPHRNPGNRAINFYAKKLHKLRDCPALIQYHTQEIIHYQGHEISLIISDYVEGDILTDFIARQPGKRLGFFQALHLLHSMCLAVEDIHRHKDYHGDLHPGNVILRRKGLGFQIKLLDFFHWGSPKPENLKDDIVDLIRVFYDVLGGQARYSKQPQVIKDICCGLKRSLILKKFKTITHLRLYLENLSWD